MFGKVLLRDIIKHYKECVLKHVLFHDQHRICSKAVLIVNQSYLFLSFFLGQGFAFYRKEKVRHEYNRLLRREKRKAPVSESMYKEEYPEHLKHLYVAEAEKLKTEAWTHRMNRMKSRMKGQDKEADVKPEGDETGADAPDQSVAAAAPEPTDPLLGDGEPAATSGKER